LQNKWQLNQSAASGGAKWGNGFRGDCTNQRKISSSLADHNIPVEQGIDGLASVIHQMGRQNESANFHALAWECQRER